MSRTIESRNSGAAAKALASPALPTPVSPASRAGHALHVRQARYARYAMGAALAGLCATVVALAPPRRADPSPPSAPPPVAAGMQAAPAAPQATPSRVEFVATMRPPARRPDAGLLVLDLEGLESPEAAVTMAENWRQRQGAGSELTCWLHTPHRTAAAEALAALTQADPPPCNRILVPR